MIKHKINSNNKHRIVITSGEPSGIGPDIMIMAIQKKWPIELVTCADPNLLLDRAKQIQLPLKLRPYNCNIFKPCEPGEISILNIPLHTPVIPGKLNIANNNYVINSLNRASIGCIHHEFSALVTGPVNKAIINKGGLAFSGHTEFLATIDKCKKTVMMLINDKLRVALMTTHIPISSVAQLITPQALDSTISILYKGLQKYFNISKPKIYICGLNPHSGESGYIGQEEINIIIPTIKKLQRQINCDIIGPLPADTIFQPKYLNDADVILSMYHDQGLTVLKYIGFQKSVNITLGLSFIRTSVDHGTALNLAGTGSAIPDSMVLAIITASNMINQSYEKKIL